MSNTLMITRPSESLLEKMVEVEAEMRKSKEYIQRCDEVSNIPDGWLKVTDDMQREIVKKFADENGFNNELSIEFAIQDLRTAHHIYPNNPIFREIPVYVRENKANVGHLEKDNPFTDVVLVDINENMIKLSDLLDHSKPNLIFAGSHT